MNYPYIETGNRILQLRKSKNLTREQLAERAGISVQFLADIEKGRKNMTVTTLRNLASALLVTTDFIVNGDENINVSDYGNLFYESQAQLADIIDELEKLTEKIKDAMLDAEEKIISDDEEDGEDVGWTVISDPGADGQQSGF